MTPLERGLALSARKEGMRIRDIARIFHRSPETISILFRKHHLPRIKPGPKPKAKPNGIHSTHSKKPFYYRYAGDDRPRGPRSLPNKTTPA